MSRPRTIRSEKILETARRLFLEGGYGVSTADIARAAGVSEGSIFNRFGTKSALFAAAMGLPAPNVEPLVEALAESEDVRAAFVEIGASIVSFLRSHMPRVMMLWAQPSLNPLDALKDCGGSSAPQRILRAVTEYVRHAAQAGRIRAQADPSVPARMFIGALHGFVFFQLVDAQDPRPAETATFIRAVVDTLWEGIRP